MTLRDSQDPIIRDTVPDVRTGIKWDAKQEVEEMESRLRHKEIVGAVQKDRAGFRSRPVSFFSKASTKGKGEMVINGIRDNEEQIRVTKAVGQAQQGIWTTWEEVETRKLSWSEIWSMELLVL